MGLDPTERWIQGRKRVKQGYPPPPSPQSDLSFTYGIITLFDVESASSVGGPVWAEWASGEMPLALNPSPCELDDCGRPLNAAVKPVDRGRRGSQP